MIERNKEEERGKEEEWSNWRKACIEFGKRGDKGGITDNNEISKMRRSNEEQWG